jgi:dephospho-CoA kinase
MIVDRNDRKRREKSVSPIRLIGLTGTNGAGKGEAAAFFLSHGYAYLSLSDVLRDALRAEGLEETRDNLIRKGNEMRRRGGPDVLARAVLDKVRGKSVIDSIRNPKEIECLRRQPGFILLAIDAPAAVRFDRVRKRGRNESATTLADFLAKEEEEKSSDPAAQQLHACLRLADRTIMNDGTIDDFRRRLEEFL